MFRFVISRSEVRLLSPAPIINGSTTMPPIYFPPHSYIVAISSDYFRSLSVRVLTVIGNSYEVSMASIRLYNSDAE